MSADLDDLELELRRLRPKTLDARLMDRLCASADGSWCRESPAEAAAARSLAELAPSPVPDHLMAALEQSLSRVPFPKEQKIVRFPQREASSPRRRSFQWAAAAAVALCGAVTALMLPAHKPQPGPVAANQGEAASAPSPAPPSRASAMDLVPAAFRRGLSEATDQGVIVRPGHQAHRVLRVVYRDRVTMRDKAGRIYQIEEPRVEYILVPARID